ncbi:DUF4296 domain-containing protein [Dysgonomonas sp. 520]|uniref:DUF4296 domain-containing protein n=1 Tax=Dysgonomonas sp. 520 TaxID=2302931 RepID=UPI0013D0E702|nr:DUF4296 domain-containing protein [Dysgonomonas sp. 520]NDW09035.1 DUF4296 domain-containing protein [Dysgonomonas sp. 520]
MNKILTYIILFASICGLSACNSDVLTEEEMTDVIYDIQLAQGIYQSRYNDFVSDDAKEALLRGIFEKHKITEAQFDSSLVWYSDNVDKLIRINDSVQSRLNRQLVVMEAQLNKGKKADLLVPHFIMLDQDVPFYAFTIRDNLLSKLIGDNITWSFNLEGLPKSTKLEAALIYEYADTTIYQDKIIDLNKEYSFSNTNPSKLERLKGYIRSDSIGMNQKIIIYDMSISDKPSEIK